MQATQHDVVELHCMAVLQEIPLQYQNQPGGHNEDFSACRLQHLLVHNQPICDNEQVRIRMLQHLLVQSLF